MGAALHHDDAPVAGRLHGLGDGLGALPGNAGVGLRPGAEPRQDRVGPADRRLKRRRVSRRQVGDDDTRQAWTAGSAGS